MWHGCTALCKCQEQGSCGTAVKGGWATPSIPALQHLCPGVHLAAVHLELASLHLRLGDTSILNAGNVTMMTPP